jgi:hypothetical protein
MTPDGDKLGHVLEIILRIGIHVAIGASLIDLRVRPEEDLGS